MTSLFQKHPVVTFLILCYGISWSVWFAILLVTDGPWAILETLVGVGMGPGLAAVLLDRRRGNAGRIGKVHFALGVSRGRGAQLLESSHRRRADRR
jgi:hypothetical protein